MRVEMMDGCGVDCFDVALGGCLRAVVFEYAEGTEIGADLRCSQVSDQSAKMNKGITLRSDVLQRSGT